MRGLSRTGLFSATLGYVQMTLALCEKPRQQGAYTVPLGSRQGSALKYMQAHIPYVDFSCERQKSCHSKVE